MSQSPEDRAKGILPINKIVTIIETKVEVENAVADLAAAGFSSDEIYVHHGEQAEKYLDFDGSDTGFFRKLVRRYQRLQGIEKMLLDDAETAVNANQYLIGVQTNGREDEQIKGRDALATHTKHHIYFCGHFTITILRFEKRE